MIDLPTEAERVTKRAGTKSLGSYLSRKSVLKDKSNKSGKSVLDGKSHCVIAAEIENGRRMYYKMGLGSHEFNRIEHPEKGDVVISAFIDDWRVQTRKKRFVTNKSITSQVVREIDVMEQLSVINASKNGLAYATRKSIITDHDWVQAPLIAQLDRMVDHQANKPFIAGVLFGDLELIVLYLYNAKGQIGKSETRISISPNSAESAIASFTAVHHLPAETEAFVFTQNELSDALLRQQPLTYPRNATILGIQYQQLLLMAAMGSWGIAALCCAWALWMHYALENEIITEMRLKKDTASITQQIGATLSRKFAALSKHTGINLGEGLKTAEQLHTNGVIVKADLSKAANKYSVTIPTKRGDRNAVLKLSSLEWALNAISTKPPKGCKVTNTGSTGALNEIQKDYLCVRVDNRPDYGW